MAYLLNIPQSSTDRTDKARHRRNLELFKSLFQPLQKLVATRALMRGSRTSGSLFQSRCWVARTLPGNAKSRRRASGPPRTVAVDRDSGCFKGKLLNSDGADRPILAFTATPGRISAR